MAATTTATPRTQKYEFVEDVYVDGLEASGRVSSERILAGKGTTFTAELAEEIVLDRRGKEPKEVATGRMYVATSDVPIAPGCLTSCINTGRAKTPEQIRADAKREAAAKAAKK